MPRRSADIPHKVLPWKTTDYADIIDYEPAIYRESPFSIRTYSDAPRTSMTFEELDEFKKDLKTLVLR